MGDEMCRAYEVDGDPVVVRGDRPFDEQDQAAFAELVRAAKKVFGHDPNVGIAQELVAAARLARWCIPDGMTDANFRMVDGTEVKERLKAAVQAAREALVPPKLEQPAEPALDAELVAAVRLAAAGRTAVEAARDLDVTIGTVKSRWRRAARQLGTRNITHTVAEAVRRGLFDEEAADV